MKVSKNYPQQRFAFLLRNEPSMGMLKELEQAIDLIANRRTWLIHPPKYVEMDVPGSSPETALHGGVFSVYSAMPPWGDLLPKEVDRTNYEEVYEIVTELCRLSGTTDMTFQLELDGTVVGSIKGGIADKLLTQGLLEPWRIAVGK